VLRHRNELTPTPIAVAFRESAHDPRRKEGLSPDRTSSTRRDPHSQRSVDNRVRGRGAGFFDAEAVVLSQLDRGEGRSGDEIVEDYDGKVVAEHAGFDPACQHGLRQVRSWPFSAFSTRARSLTSTA
jgi:hypothetical protein